MQGIMETIFDIWYLCTIIFMGIKILKKSNGNKQYLLFGAMALLLGFGDAFHLVPRCYGLLTIGLPANAVWLGIGKFITSITMTIFYVLLYYIWRLRYNITNKNYITYTIHALAIERILICFSRENEWFSYNGSYSYGIYRNIPFLIMGIIIIVIFYQESIKNNDLNFKYMWLAITLSFILYAVVVLFADTIPLLGMLMIPKTIAYVYIVYLGYKEIRDKDELLY